MRILMFLALVSTVCAQVHQSPFAIGGADCSITSSDGVLNFNCDLDGAGVLLGAAGLQTSDYYSSTADTTWDNSKVQYSEGINIASISYTPKNVGSILLVQVSFNDALGWDTVSDQAIVAIYTATSGGSLAAVAKEGSRIVGNSQLMYLHEVTSLDEITFYVNFTIVLNSPNSFINRTGTPYLDGAWQTVLTVMEFKQ